MSQASQMSQASTMLETLQVSASPLSSACLAIFRRMMASLVKNQKTDETALRISRKVIKWPAEPGAAAASGSIMHAFHIRWLVLMEGSSVTSAAERSDRDVSPT